MILNEENLKNGATAEVVCTEDFWDGEPYPEKVELSFDEDESVAIKTAMDAVRLNGWNGVSLDIQPSGDGFWDNQEITAWADSFKWYGFRDGVKFTTVSC